MFAYLAEKAVLVAFIRKPTSCQGITRSTTVIVTNLASQGDRNAICACPDRFAYDLLQGHHPPDP